MPRKNTKARKNRNISGSTSSQVGDVGGFADRLRTRLVFTEDNTMATTTTAVTNRVFAGNSVFSPYAAGGGQQPNNYDDLSLQYARYRVYGCDVRVDFFPLGAATGTGAMEVAVCPRATSSVVNTVAGFDNAVTNKGAISKMVSVATGQSTIKMRLKSTQILGMTSQTFEGQDDAEALVTSDPALRWFIHVLIRTIDGTSTTVGFYRITITYDVLFYERYPTALDSKIERYQRFLASKRAQIEPRPLSEVIGEQRTAIAHLHNGVYPHLEDDFVVVRKRPTDQKHTPM